MCLLIYATTVKFIEFCNLREIPAHFTEYNLSKNLRIYLQKTDVIKVLKLQYYPYLLLHSESSRSLKRFRF